VGESPKLSLLVAVDMGIIVGSIANATLTWGADESLKLVWYADTR
jgi:hypothetical protein